MNDWAAANLKLRADRDAMDEQKRREAAEPAATPSCGNVFADLGLPDAEMLLTEAEARASVGDEARPTGKLRIQQAGTTGRLQHEWRGPFGSIWLDVPVQRVAELAPRCEPAAAVSVDCGCSAGALCRQNAACPRLKARKVEQQAEAQRQHRAEAA